MELGSWVESDRTCERKGNQKPSSLAEGNGKFESNLKSHVQASGQEISRLIPILTINFDNNLPLGAEFGRQGRESARAAKTQYHRNNERTVQTFHIHKLSRHPQT